MKYRNFFCVLMTLVAPTIAQAESASEILDSCKFFRTLVPVFTPGERFPDRFQVGMCWAAIGALQGAIVLTDKSGKPILNVCAPPESNRPQLVAIFIKYAEDNPQLLHRPFVDVALQSLRTAFPCRPSK